MFLPHSKGSFSANAALLQVLWPVACPEPQGEGGKQGMGTLEAALPSWEMVEERAKVFV